MLVPKLRFKREDGSEYPTWKSGTIGDYYIFKNGLNKEKSAFGQGTPIINYTDVFKNRLLTSKIIKGRVTLNDKEIENHSAVYGDVFFTRTSETLDEVGFCGALIEHIQDCVFSGFLLRGRPKDDTSISPNFAGYYFMTKPIREEIISKSSITTRALTNGRNLSAVNVKIPCLEEQQKIADFLSTIDEVIAQSEAEVQNLEQQKKAAMQKIFSQEVRFKREDGTEYPKWENKPLSEICDVRDGTHDSPKYVGEGFPLVTSKNLTKYGTIDFTNVNFIKEDDYNMINVRSKVDIGDILFGMIGTIGKPVLVNSVGFAIKNVALLKPLYINNAYLFYYLQSDDVEKAFRYKQTGNTQKFIALSTIRQIKIVVPYIEEQQKIADFLSTYDEAIHYAKQELDKWKELKKGLLQQMFV